jgi:hypothetical protein
MNDAITYSRVPHAAHYGYSHPAKGHDLEQWDVADIGRHVGSGNPLRPEGVPSDAEYRCGYLAKDGSQRWLFVRTAPLSEGTCEWCRT